MLGVRGGCVYSMLAVGGGCVYAGGERWMSICWG